MTVNIKLRFSAANFHVHDLLFQYLQTLSEDGFLFMLALGIVVCVCVRAYTCA